MRHADEVVTVMNAGVQCIEFNKHTTLEDLEEAIKKTIKAHEEALAEDRHYDGGAMSCELCKFERNFAGDMNTGTCNCPWLLFEGEVCDEYADEDLGMWGDYSLNYKDNEESIKRLKAWLEGLDEVVVTHHEEEE